ncbi:hypothetical protein [Streptomyces xylophagus]|uniref:hypothetical protein n=1 Tax=Streptomyces xylophagus TaxID=285514 RepID=UPI000A4184D5|nr:hypothetical protein [Streptomyces xylophagus]
MVRIGYTTMTEQAGPRELVGHLADLLIATEPRPEPISAFAGAPQFVRPEDPSAFTDREWPEAAEAGPVHRES